MSRDRSISPEPVMKSRSRQNNGGANGKDRYDQGNMGHSSLNSGQKRRRHSHSRTPSPISPRSVGSQSPGRNSVEELKSPINPRASGKRHSSPTQKHSSSSSKRRRPKDVESEPTNRRRKCLICSESVEDAKHLYGILENCDHVFCYECIVSWKRSRFNNSDSENCPACKVRSAFITPSKNWYESNDEKYRIIKNHKDHLKTLPCRYYIRHGFCRYSDRCFYDHDEADKQYRQLNRGSRDRDRDRGERDRGERDRGERDRGERDRGERDRGERDRGERDRGERDRGERDRGDRERDRDRDHHGNFNRQAAHHGSRPSYQSPSPHASSSRYSSTRHREHVR